MKSLVLLTATVALTCAGPLPQSPNEQQFHSSASDEFVKDVRKFLTAYDEFIPRIINKELGEMNANPEEIKGYEEYVQSAYLENSEPPKTLKGMIEFYKQNLPLSASRIQRVVDYFTDGFAKISKPGQDLITEFIAKSDSTDVTGENGVVDNRKRDVNLVDALTEADDKFNALSPSVKKEFMDQYQELMRLYNAPEIQEFLYILQTVKGKADNEKLHGLYMAGRALKPLTKRMY